MRLPAPIAKGTTMDMYSAAAYTAYGLQEIHTHCSLFISVTGLEVVNIFWKTSFKKFASFKAQLHFPPTLYPSSPFFTPNYLWLLKTVVNRRKYKKNSGPSPAGLSQNVLVCTTY